MNTPGLASTAPAAKTATQPDEATVRAHLLDHARLLGRVDWLAQHAHDPNEQQHAGDEVDDSYPCLR
jgi:hypothetical protein